MINSRFNSKVSDKDDILAREIIRENTGGKDPEIALVEDFLEELDLRLEQVKVYAPIMDMFRKRKSEDELAVLLPELSFLILAFLIYEGKLKHRGITFHNIEAFLSKALKRILTRDVEPATARKITAEVLDGLQNGGRNFIFDTYSFINGGLKEKFVKFLEIKQSEDGLLQYFITEQGVDFYLRTKEFPEETKITINLLLFQKQMEKGAFGFAYETVRRLNMEVQKKRDKKYSLLEALMYGRLDGGEAYHSYHDGIVMQLAEEAELFNTAVKNVSNAFNEYMERINDGLATEKERRTFSLIKIIEKEIGRAQTLHTELLKEAVGFTGEYDQALSIRRKAIFTERFNFQGEFDKLANQNQNPGALKYLFEPLLIPHLKKGFNPLRAMEPQRMLRERQEEETSRDNDSEAGRQTLDSMISLRVGKNFLFYAARLLELLGEPAQQVYLTDFCHSLVGLYGENSVYNGDFLSFILEMNRDKNIGEHSRMINFADGHVTEDPKTIEEVFIKAALAANLDGRINRVSVASFPEEEVELLPGLKITNMLFTGERIP